MNCKNCSFELSQKDNFCKECGAKIVKERITIKSLFSYLLHALGWDSNFFVTLRYLAYKPQLVAKAYIGGTRKKYTNPFTFFAISLAISLFVFSQYSEKFIEMSSNVSLQQLETVESQLSENIKDSRTTKMFGYKNQEEFLKAISKFSLKYNNLLSFLTLPFYTLFAFLVFRKPYNFGEHLVIITYLHGILSFLGLFLFIISLLTKINLYIIGSFILLFFYYSFTYKMLYKLTFGQLFFKILKFIGLLLVFTIITFIIGTIGVLIYLYLTEK